MLLKKIFIVVAAVTFLTGCCCKTSYNIALLGDIHYDRMDLHDMEVYKNDRVFILGTNGCGKTTLFNILTGAMDYDSGEVFINPHKRIGLISQIPKFPEGYTVEHVLRSAFAPLMAMQRKMETLEKAMAAYYSSTLEATETGFRIR